MKGTVRGPWNMRWVRWTALRLVALWACTGFAAATSAAETLLEGKAFQLCEAEAFASLIIARNAMQLNDTRESLMAGSGSPEQAREVAELFDEIERTKGKDHGKYAARRFYDCARRENLGVKEDIEWASVCLSRHDIVFYVGADRVKGTPQSEAAARAKRTLSRMSAARYPEPLIDAFVPMIYRVQSSDDDYLMRRFVFESCLFPDEFKRMLESNQAIGK